jgi:hypothetical protein
LCFEDKRERAEVVVAVQIIDVLMNSGKHTFHGRPIDQSLPTDGKQKEKESIQSVGIVPSRTSTLIGFREQITLCEENNDSSSVVNLQFSHLCIPSFDHAAVVSCCFKVSSETMEIFLTGAVVSQTFLPTTFWFSIRKEYVLRKQRTWHLKTAMEF